ncbi:MAG TPA: hypothetical protein VG826_05185 [Pirellulales bacterium]|nr:hypothetical protein [Pirellulales bacterium]
MQPVRLLLIVLSGFAAFAVLNSALGRPVLSSRGVARRLTRRALPLHYNRLAAFYRPCVN